MLYNIPYFLIPLFVWCCAQLTKICIDRFYERPIDRQSLWTSGGFPSTHGTLTSSMMMIVFLVDWWQSTLFMVTTIFSVLIWYDAANVRYESWKHAQYINSIKQKINQVFIAEHIQSKGTLPWLFLKERIGHTPIEVVAGIVYGASLTLLVYSLLHYFL